MSTRLIPTFPSLRLPLPPDPVEPYDIPHPALPAALDGLTILHLSDLHARWDCRARPSFRRILHAVGACPVDLVVFTGDLMHNPGDELASRRMLDALAAAWRSRLGAIGVFGNHDTLALKDVVRDHPAVTWLDPVGVVHLDDAAPRAPLRIVGSSWPEDLLGALLGWGGAGVPPATPPPTQESTPFTLTLAHMPTAIVPAADLNLPLVLAGHTHAGQVRRAARLRPRVTSSRAASTNVAPDTAAGVLRLRSTLCCVSRGMGEAILAGLRINCPVQVPLYTLRRAPLPDTPDPLRVTQVVAW